MKYRETKFFGFLIIVLATILWAVNGNVSAFLFANKGVTPEQLVTIRLVISGIIQLAFHKMDKSKNFFGVFEDKNDILRLIIFAFAGILLMQYSYFVTVKYSNAATAVILQQFAPFFVILIGSVTARRFPPIKTIIALCLALFGGFLIVTHGNIHSLAISNVALIFGLSASLGSTIFNIAPAPIQQKHGIIQVNGWSMLISSIVFAIIMQPWKTSFVLEPITIIAITYVAIFGTLLPFLLYMTGAQILSPSVASILSLLESVMSPIIATTFLGVQFVLLDYIGIALVIIALFLIMLPIRSNRPEDQL